MLNEMREISLQREYKVEEASLAMALADAIPVLLFCGSSMIIALLFDSVLFLIGAICCVLAGVGKVLWKLLLAVRHRNVFFLSRQLRILMPAGFFLMLVSVFVNRSKISIGAAWKMVSAFPVSLLFLLGIAACILMAALAVSLDKSKSRTNWIEQAVNIFAQTCFLLGLLTIWYASDYYRGDMQAKQALESHDNVTVSQIEKGWFFDGPGGDAALIFYPGAKVECTAYAPLLHLLAGKGVDCFLMEMPLNLAVFGVNLADDVRREYSYERWYLGGHSLGGAIAASYVSGHSGQLDGLILLAAYPTRNLQEDVSAVLSIYGSEDRVIRQKSMENGRVYMPEKYTERCIQGGNHAWFGSYGEQAGDGAAAISHEEQWEQTAEAIIEEIGRE